MINFALFIPSDDFFEVFLRESFSIATARHAVVFAALQRSEIGEYIVAFDDDPDQWMFVAEAATDSAKPLTEHQLSALDLRIRRWCSDFTCQ